MQMQFICRDGNFYQFKLCACTCLELIWGKIVRLFVFWTYLWDMFVCYWWYLLFCFMWVNRVLQMYFVKQFYDVFCSIFLDALSNIILNILWIFFLKYSLIISLNNIWLSFLKHCMLSFSISSRPGPQVGRSPTQRQGVCKASPAVISRDVIEGREDYCVAIVVAGFTSAMPTVLPDLSGTRKGGMTS